jgi:hypothetical protein
LSAPFLRSRITGEFRLDRRFCDRASPARSVWIAVIAIAHHRRDSFESPLLRSRITGEIRLGRRYCDSHITGKATPDRPPLGGQRQ